MERHNGVAAQPDLPIIEPRPHRPSRLECLGGVIVSPVKTFAYLADRPQWLFPLIIIGLYVLVIFVARMAAMSAVMFTAGREFGGEETNLFFLLMSVMSSGITFGMGVFAALVVLGAMTGALYAVLRAFGAQPHFYALLSTLAYAEFVPRLVGASLKEFITLLTGELSLWSEKIPTGIAPIFSEFNVPLLVQFLLARIEVFHLWSFALVAIAVRFVARVTAEKAMLVTIIYWAICIVTVTVAAFASGEVTGRLF